MGRELELKFRADAAQLAAIRADHPGTVEIQMETAYYDTADRIMSARRETLRRRYENGRAVYALKTRLPDGSHGEWETEADSLSQGLAALSAMGAPDLPRAEELEVFCGARFTRSCLLLSIPGGTAELAMDVGCLLGGGKELPLSEVELELKEGPDDALLTYGAAFARRYRLEEEPRSKFGRARSLTE